MGPQGADAMRDVETEEVNLKMAGRCQFPNVFSKALDATVSRAGFQCGFKRSLATGEILENTLLQDPGRARSRRVHTADLSSCFSVLCRCKFAVWLQKWAAMSC